MQTWKYELRVLVRWEPWYPEGHEAGSHSGTNTCSVPQKEGWGGETLAEVLTLAPITYTVAHNPL